MARQVQQTTDPIYRGRLGAILIPLLLAAAVFAVYGQTAKFWFVGYDDPDFLVNNPHIRGGLTPSSIAWAFRSGYAANWFPLTWLSYLLGVSLYGLDAGWHHLTNVLLHAVNTVLLFEVLRRMTGCRWRSALVAFVFGVHPLHVEAVAWIAERREVLSGMFWVLSLWAYMAYVKRPRPWAYIALLAAFAGGLMSKPMIVTLPFALLLLDYWPLRRWQTAPVRRLILEKLPLIALAAAGSAITMLIQQGGGAVSSLAEVPFGYRIENALVSYVAYVVQFFWPARLAVLYPYESGLPWWEVLGAAVLLAGITGWAIFERRRRPYLLVGWLWFAGVLVPVVGLVQVGVQSRADRYMYMPLVGLAMALVWGVAESAGRRGMAAAAAVFCCYGVVAWNAASYWRDTVTLFRHTVEVTHDNWAADITLSQALLTQNRVDEAVPYIQEALRLRPNLPEAHVNYGAALSKRSEFDAAAEQYRTALKLDSGNIDAQAGLGVVLIEKGQLGEALNHLQAAEKSRPDDPDIHYNLGRLYGVGGRPDLATAEFLESVQLAPENAAARFNLGTAYAAQDRYEEAAEQFREALRKKPDYAAAHFNLGSALANMERFDEAIAQFQEVLRLEPGSQQAAQAIQECLELKKQSGR